MLKPGFIDLSHHNTIPESLAPAAASGIMGVIHKATEGSSYVDDKMEARYQLARDADLLWGIYHFIRPGSVEAQVDHFLDSSVEACDDNTLFCLDWEDSGVSLADAIEFMQRVEQITGRSPVIYSGHILKEAHGEPCAAINCYRLWLAQYASSPELPPGWSKFWGWQYTDQGDCPGIVSPVDLNAFDGTREELANSWSGGGAPEPQPEPEAVEVTVIVPPGVNVRVITTKAP